jgi:hypothetical protein
MFFFGLSNSILHNQKQDRRATNSFQFLNAMEITPPPMIAKLQSLCSGAPQPKQKLAIISARTF